MASTAQEVPPQTRTKKRRRAWARAAIGLVILLLAAEGALRGVFGLGSPLLYQTDADCGYLPKPQQDIQRFFSHNFINQYGMRSADFQAQPVAGTERLFLIGDSVTYATTYVDQSKIWTTLLGNTLPQIEHKPVEVLSMSAGGSAPSNEYGYLRSRGTFHAGLVVFVVNSGDTGEEFAKLTPGDVNFPLHNPLTAVGETWQRYVLPRIMQHVTADPGTTIPPADVLARNTAANMQVYADAKAFAEKNGAVFGMIYIPFPSAIGHGDEQPHGTMTHWTAENHVPLIDVAPRFAQEDVARLSKDGIHPTPYADTVIADEIEKQWPIMQAALAAHAAPVAAAQ